MKRPLCRSLLVAALFAGCGERPETYGFVATLGDDTTSIERVTRTPTRITGEAVGRSPAVVRRRWTIDLADDGSVRRWTIDTHIPNAPAGRTELHHEGVLERGTVRLVRHAPGDTMDVTYRAPFAATVPWNAFLYATWELLLEAASRQPDGARIGQYFFEGWEEGRIGHATVRDLGGGRFSVASTGLSGAGIAEVDERGRMVSYSGAGTTYKQEVRRVAEVGDIGATLSRFAAAERTRGVQTVLSTRDVARGRIGDTEITVEYGRPLARGRTLVGALIPYDRVWRTGANAATHLTVTGPVRLAGLALDPGSYTLWTLPTRGGVQLIVNRQTGQWGTGYRPAHDLGRAPMRVETLPHTERFTIAIEPDSAGAVGSGRLVMRWGDFGWTAPIEVDARRAAGP